MDERFKYDPTERQQLISVSNRLPDTAYVDEDGSWQIKKSSGGLASALAACEELEMKHVGWPGADVPGESQAQVSAEFGEHSCYPVYLSQDEIDLYYNGFSNGVLWPLFHYVTPALNTETASAEWGMYMAVNRIFARAVVDMLIAIDAPIESTLIWVHDYHLMLVPKFIRELLPSANIGWFLHTPFPSVELFRMLPYREAILHGLLSSNFIGFQVPDYCGNFLACCSQLTNLQVTPFSVDAIPIGGAFVQTGAVPIGIDPAPFVSLLADTKVEAKMAQFRHQFGERKVILGVDRLDYMKGLEQKLRAFDLFLTDHPEWHDRVVLVQLAVPSRSEVKEYQRLKKHVHELVGQVSGKHSQLSAQNGSPVLYLDQAVDHTDLVALYALSDVLLITSLRDGMNLVAFEYVASQQDRNGVLILSEFTGAMQSLAGGALRVNPWNLVEVSEALGAALTMSDIERAIRHKFCYEYVCTHTAQRWAETFLDHLRSAIVEASAVAATVPPVIANHQIADVWQAAGAPPECFVTPEPSSNLVSDTIWPADSSESSERSPSRKSSSWRCALVTEHPITRFLLVDLTSCLLGPIGFVRHPHLAQFPVGVATTIKNLLASPSTVLVITSPYSREVMEALFGTDSAYEESNLILAPENGCVFKSYHHSSSNEWINVYPRELGDATFSSFEWRQALRRLIDFFQERTPHSFVEETEFSVKWFTDMHQSGSTVATLRELLFHRWAGPLNQSDADVVLADRYVEIRPKASSIVANIGRIFDHPDVKELLGASFTMGIVMGEFPYADESIYQIIGERLAQLVRCTLVNTSELTRLPSTRWELTNFRKSLSRPVMSVFNEEEEASGEKPIPRSQSQPGFIMSPRSSTRRSLSDLEELNIAFYAITVSHSKISRAQYSLPTQLHAEALLEVLGEKDAERISRARGG